MTGNAESRLDPVTLQVLVGALRSACDEMGAVLIHAAHSANVKERRDCSTALFDDRGELVMQAEHIPVHLGSMPDAVAAVISEEQRPDDLWILNDPYEGGTHLPDITLIGPIFCGERLLGFAASRAHHADVGGPTPAGMPVASRTLDEEGVVIPPTRATPESLAELALQMRNPAERRADLLAQRSAVAVGERRLVELADRYGEEVLRAGMAEILDYAERRTRARLGELPDGSWSAEDFLEGGSDGSVDVRLRVEATIAGDGLRLDFAGTDEQVEGNLNCPLSVTKSAAFFAVRVLVDPDAPPSAGAHRPVEVAAPPGCLLNAWPSEGRG
jgi:N-methylhydantoinase B